jgi:hypothetical protein
VASFGVAFLGSLRAEERRCHREPRQLHTATAIPAAVLGPDPVVPDELGAFGAPAWPMAPWAHPASTNKTKSAASRLGQFIACSGLHYTPSPPDASLDHLVRGCEQRGRNVKAECLGSVQIYDELVLVGK